MATARNREGMLGLIARRLQDEQWQAFDDNTGANLIAAIQGAKVPERRALLAAIAQRRWNDVGQLMRVVLQPNVVNNALIEAGAMVDADDKVALADLIDVFGRDF